MQAHFQLDQATVHLAHINPRTEKHGDRDVPAADLKVQMRDGSGLLSMFHPTLRSMLYKADESEGRQLEGVEALTQLRFGSLIEKLRLGHELKGAEVVISFGLGGGFGYLSGYRGRGWIQCGAYGRRHCGADLPHQGPAHRRANQASVRGAGWRDHNQRHARCRETGIARAAGRGGVGRRLSRRYISKPNH